MAMWKSEEAAITNMNIHIFSGGIERQQRATGRGAKGRQDEETISSIFNKDNQLASAEGSPQGEASELSTGKKTSGPSIANTGLFVHNPLRLSDGFTR
ncbi:MAG: hypothetical protein WA414_06565 [Acidobacteriaceae bacterium]